MNVNYVNDMSYIVSMIKYNPELYFPMFEEFITKYKSRFQAEDYEIVFNVLMFNQLCGIVRWWFKQFAITDDLILRFVRSLCIHVQDKWYFEQWLQLLYSYMIRSHNELNEHNNNEDILKTLIQFDRDDVLCHIPSSMYAYVFEYDSIRCYNKFQHEIVVEPSYLFLAINRVSLQVLQRVLHQPYVELKLDVTQLFQSFSDKKVAVETFQAKRMFRLLGLLLTYCITHIGVTMSDIHTLFQLNTIVHVYQFLEDHAYLIPSLHSNLTISCFYTTIEHHKHSQQADEASIWQSFFSYPIHFTKYPTLLKTSIAYVSLLNECSRAFKYQTVYV